MNFTKCLAALVIAIVSLPAFAQKPTVDTILERLSREFPIEKVYVQTDRSHYLQDDSLWFKAYLMSGGLPSKISTNLLIDLADATGSVLRQTAWPVVESSAAGSINLKGLKPGSYQFRAYTPWMLNSDTGFFFYKSIQVISAEAGTKQTQNYDFNMQLLPEGGHWVADVVNNMAFIARGNDGKPADVKGRIVDAEGETVADISCVHDGMGSFLMMPMKGQRYKAEVEYRGIKKSFDLPPAVTDEVALRMQASGDNLMFQLQAGETYTGAGVVTVVAFMDQQLVYKAVAPTDRLKAGISGRIPLEGLPSGILTLTVLTESWKPLAERIYFVPKKQDSTAVQVVLSKDTFSVRPRSLNVWELDVPGIVEGANLSVSITDADRVPGPENEDNIISRMLLTGEIRGRVYQPGWYLNKPYDSTKKAIDLLMLTQGWRKYYWDYLARGLYPAIRVKPEPYLQLKGDAFNLAGRKPLANTSIALIMTTSESKVPKIFSIDTDPTGSFLVSGLAFFDTARIYFNINKSKGDNKDVILRLSNAVQSTGSALSPLADRFNFVVTDTAMKNLIANNRSVYDKLYGDKNTLAEVVVRARKKSATELLEEKYVSGLFSTGDGFTFDLINDPTVGGLDIFQYLQGRIPGLQITNAGTVTMTYRGSGSPALFLDEMPTDVNMLQGIPITDIAMVKFLRPPFIGASGGGGNGAIAIYTKKGDEYKAGLPGMGTTRLGGYSVMKNFYSPDYEKYPDENPYGDYRSTLLWVPFLFPTEDSTKSTLRFFNNDQTKRFRVVVEGVDKAGQLIRMERVVE